MIDEIKFPRPRYKDLPTVTTPLSYKKQSELSEDEIHKLRMYQTDELMWRRVEDELPEENGRYLVTVNTINNICTINWWKDDIWEETHHGCGGFKVTHWMPLPEEPQEWNTHD